MKQTRKPHKPHWPAGRNPAGGWQIVYTGFVLILLCFFVMLTSFASFQESKITRFVRSFSNAVTVFSGGASVEKEDAMINSDAKLLNKEDQVALLFEKVQQLGQTNGLEQLDVRRTKKGVIMTLSEKTLFSSGSATLSKGAHPILNKISKIIKTLKVQIEIEGHTDDRPINTFAFPSNWELSTARAVNVLRFMTEEQGVASRLISAVGMNQYHPVAPNDSEINRNKNRRVEIIFKPL